MGTTTKIWPASNAEIAKCLAEPGHVGFLFARCDDYAMIHDSRELASLLRALAQRGPTMREVEDASDPSYVMSPEGVAALIDEAMGDPHRDLLEFRSICVNGVQIMDLVKRTAASERGLVFCAYEDW